MNFLVPFAQLAGYYLFIGASIFLLLAWGTENDLRRDPDKAGTWQQITADFGTPGRIETCLWAGALWPVVVMLGIAWAVVWAARPAELYQAVIPSSDGSPELSESAPSLPSPRSS